MAHAEASARTVDAAVSAAAAQLGLRSDQVDVEVLEEPVPSTFGYIGSPARVRVTARTTPPSIGAEPGGPSTTSGTAGSALGSRRGGSAGGISGVGGGSAGGGSEPAGAGTELHPTDHPSAQEHSTEANVSNDAADPSMPAAASATPPAPAHRPATATETGNGQVPTDHSSQPRDQLAVQTPESSASSQKSPGPSESRTEPATGLVPSGPSAAADASTPAAPAPAASTPAAPGPAATGAAASAAPSVPATSAVPDSVAASAPTTPPAAAPEAASSPSSPSSHSTPEAVSVPAAASSPSFATAPETARQEEPGSSRGGTRPPRRTYKDEPIEPQMVEEDTERAGDFLEGLLDALDVDGDITTWVDEVGGHIDLEGTDLEVLVGPNGETLDALQELTRLAVLRQSKRRVRLLIDINGFRARQREQLTSMVRTTVEQVIRTREDHELQPMTPAERKIVHDAVAAIEGARTESLGEEPNRRVVIRPA